jgi:hypothetical protein
MANPHRTSEQWHQIFEQYNASGMKIAAFCKQQKLNPSSFYAWRKRLANPSLCPSIIAEKKQPDWLGIIPESIAEPSR